MARPVSWLKVLGMAFATFFLFLSLTQAKAATKVRLATSSVVEPFQLPVIAAQEQELWKKHGLAVEWVQIRGAAMAMKTLAAGNVDAGLTNAINAIWSIARGVPAVIIASVAQEEFFIWVSGQGPIRSPADLKGKKIAVSSLGGSIHAYGQASVNALGLGKDVKFVATGGPRESLAAFRAGSVDGMVTTLRTMIRLKVSGDARELVSVQDYLPKEWADYIMYVHRRLARTEPGTVRQLGEALAEALKFLRANPGWVMDKMKSGFGRTDQEAKLILEKKAWVISADGGLSRREVQNVSDFLVQYGLVPKEGLPPLEEYFAPVFPR